MHLVGRPPRMMFDNHEGMEDRQYSQGFSRSRSYSHQVQSRTAQEVLNLMPSTHRLDFEFNLEDHIKKTRKAASYLKQVFHSQQCGGKCTSPHCRRIVRVLQHIDQCQNEQCLVPGCSTTKKLLRHSIECQSSNNSPCSTAVLNTPTLQSSKGNHTANNLNTHLAITPSNRFCLLCTIAHSDSALEPTSQSTKHEDAMDTEDPEESVHYDSHFDRQFMPIISDEIIEFSRVPFQQHQQRMKTMSNDGINFVFLQPIASSQVHARSPMSQPEAKKARSKSLNAMSADALALQQLHSSATATAASAGFH